jgi:hypothetical protein
MFGGSRYEGTITAKDHQMQKFMWMVKMYGTSNSNVPENRALNVEVKRMAAMQSTNLFQHLERASF